MLRTLIRAPQAASQLVDPRRRSRDPVRWQIEAEQVAGAGLGGLGRYAPVGH